MIAVTFFFNTWEEYYTGSLDLPIMHGVSEGCVISCVVMILTGYYGHEMWLQNVTIYGQSFRLNNFVVVCSFAVSTVFSLIR